MCTTMPMAYLSRLTRRGLSLTKGRHTAQLWGGPVSVVSGRASRSPATGKPPLGAGPRSPARGACFRGSSSRSSSDSCRVTPGRVPSSTSAARSQFRRHDSLIPKPFATCDNGASPRRAERPRPRRRGTPWGGAGVIDILPAAASAATRQMSTEPAAVPRAKAGGPPRQPLPVDHLTGHGPG